MTTKRFADNPQLASLAGTEIFPATSVDGGTDTESGTVSPGDDIKVPFSQLLAPRIVSSVISNTITPDATTDLIRPPALTAAITIANPSADPPDAWGMVIELIDNGTAQALTWGSMFANRMASLPATTVAGKRHRIAVEYNAADDKLYCMVAQVQS